MAQSRHYKKAPITEALIDLRIELVPEIGLPILKSLQTQLFENYPTCEDIILAQGQFQAGSSVSATATQSVLGYRFSSSDKKQILQARRDGFTFSRLEPYINWETLRDEAKHLWKLYSETVRPKSIERIAVRYINRLDLPLDPSHPLDFKDYLLTVPEVSPDLPQGLNDYFMQLQIPQDDLEAFLILNESIIPPSKENIVSILLDIDLFSSVHLTASDDTLWQLLEKFRIRKNEVFEACITDKTRELIK